MLYFSNYANKKFDILNDYGVYITKEQVAEVVKSPDQSTKKGLHLYIQKENLKIIVKKEGKNSKVITFFPTK